MANLLLARKWRGLEQGHRGHDHPTRAVSALPSAFLEEGALHGVKRVTDREPFDRHDGSPGGVVDAQRACRDGMAVNEYDTGTAHAMTASESCADEP
jgi:hypothetical protein